jgi:hypothetical protein
LGDLKVNKHCVNLLDTLVLPMVVSGAVMMNCTTCKMEHHNILLCPFVRGFAAVLVVGELGVEGKYGRREILFLFSVILFRGFGPERRPVVEKQEHAMNWNKVLYVFAAVRLYFLRKIVESVSCMGRLA